MRVVVGMSGGVDSAVSALLLKQQGYEVAGLFMKNWDSNLNNDSEGITEDICPQEQDYKDALEVCNSLDIPLYRVDFIEEYWNNVFTYFLNELKKGRTPNPDVMCNKYIKFDVFIKEARRLFPNEEIKIATGHYARIEHTKLLRGVDNNKDQTYFLCKLSPNQLKDVMFPIGELTKPEVRKIAEENNLVVSHKKDSTGICFIGERHYQQFVQNYLKPNPGDIINVETKEVIGRHNGLMNYTIGQRKNVGLSGDKEKHYVCGKDAEKNILYVAFGEDNDYLMSNEALLEDVSFISETRPSFITVKFRYRGEDIPCEIEYLENDEAIVHYESAKSVTPGQVCAFYLGSECLGGSIIKEVRKNGEKLWYLN